MCFVCPKSWGNSVKQVKYFFPFKIKINIKGKINVSIVKVTCGCFCDHIYGKTSNQILRYSKVTKYY